MGDIQSSQILLCNQFSGHAFVYILNGEKKSDLDLKWIKQTLETDFFVQNELT